MEERSFSSFVCVAGPPIVVGNRLSGLAALLFENIVLVSFRLLFFFSGTERVRRYRRRVSEILSRA